MKVILYKTHGRRPYRCKLVNDHRTLTVSKGHLTRLDAERTAANAFPELRREKDASWGT